MDLLTSIILWGFVGLLVIGMLIGIYLTEFKYVCNTNKPLEKNLNAKFHADLKLVSSEIGFYNDSGFTIGYDYCQVYYCLRCGVISHWGKGKMSVDDYLNIIKDDSNRKYIIEKLNEYILIANNKYKLNRKVLQL